MSDLFKLTRSASEALDLIPRLRFGLVWRQGASPSITL